MKSRGRGRFQKTTAAMSLYAILIALPAMPRSAASVGQENVTSEGIVNGRVTLPDKTDGISDVTVTLHGPALTIDSLSSLGLYTPRAELTPAMRRNIDTMLEGYIAFPPERVAREALALEARLLGLPAPAGPSVGARGAADPGPMPRTITTDSGGLFSFQHLPPGRYVVVAQREGYFGIPSGNPVVDPAFLPRANTTDVTVRERTPTPDVALRLNPGSVISGRVRDPGGAPLVNFPVAAYQVTYREGRAALLEVTTTKTDDRGEYRLGWLLPRDYLIAANPRPRSAAPSSQDAFVQTFYSGAPDARSAPPIAVTPGTILTADIQMRADATGKVSGRILNPFVGSDGKRTEPSSTMYLVSRDPNALDLNVGRSFQNTLGRSFSNSPARNLQNAAALIETGVFEIQNVPPGSYDLWASAPAGNGRSAWGRAQVDISGRDLQDVAIAIKPGAEVKIRVTLDGGPPPSTLQTPPARGAQQGQSANSNPPTGDASQTAPPVMRPSIAIKLAPVGSFDAAASTANSGLAFDPAGIYTFPNVPEGRYLVTVSSLPANAYVEDIRPSAASLFDEGLSISGSSVEVNVTIRTNGTSAVKGTVADVEGHPVNHSAFVALVPQQPRRGNITLYKTTTSGSNGAFEIKGVVPGEYKVFAWELVPLNAWTNADFLARFEQRGKAVNVTAGAPTSVDLVVIPKSQMN